MSHFLTETGKVRWTNFVCVCVGVCVLAIRPEGIPALLTVTGGNCQIYVTLFPFCKERSQFYLICLFPNTSTIRTKNLIQVLWATGTLWLHAMRSRDANKHQPPKYVCAIESQLNFLVVCFDVVFFWGWTLKVPSSHKGCILIRSLSHLLRT